MSDRVLVPLSDGRWLALDREAFQAAVALGRELMASSAGPSAGACSQDESRELLDADAIARLFHLKPSWLLERARLNEIPHVRLGKYVRFDPGQIRAHLGRGPDKRTADPGGSRKPMNGKNL